MLSYTIPLPGLDARLVASISNLVFARFPPGTARQPFTTVYRYCVASSAADHRDPK